MKKTVVHLLTARVSGVNQKDNTSIIERINVKLEVGKSFNNFIKHLPLVGLVAAEPPKVLKVLEFTPDKKEPKEIDTKPYQALVDAAVKPQQETTKEGADFKELYEKQAEQTEAQQAEIQELRDLIKNMNSGGAPVDGEDEDDLMGLTQREQLVNKANELEITFNKTIGDQNLLDRILEKDPNFEIK